MKDIKKDIKENGRSYFKRHTPELDFSNKLAFAKPEPVYASPRKKWMPLAWLTGSLTLTLASSVALGAIILTSPERAYDPADRGLAQVRDVDELRDLISTSYDRQTGGNPTFNETDLSSAATEGMSDDTPSHSDTNVQVPGVDEGDIIKTDGDRIYKINYNRLQVIDVLADGQMELALDQALNSENENNSYTYFSDLYLTDSYMAVIGQRYTWFVYETKDDSEGADIEPWYGYWYGIPQTVVLIYDIDALTLVHEAEINGYILSSRRIDERLYVISNHYPVMVEEDDDPRPVFRFDDEIIVPNFTDIKYLENMPTETFTIITTIFLDADPNLEFDIFLGASSWGQIYVSKQAIYLASYFYFYSSLSSAYSYHGLLMSYLFEEDGTVVYGGAGTYDGYVINQFAIDEYDGYLRIVTTEWWGGDDGKIDNRLYVFERQVIDGKLLLSKVAELSEGLGKPGETVRSVRFNGTMATVVTYEQTDPFYTIDLTDPYHPTIQAGLEISGYSTYQHLWSDTLIIGIGYEAEGNIIKGLKMTMFDVTDPEKPLVVGTPLVLLNQENGWTYSEALYNHKALLVSHEFDILGFAISRWYYGNDGYWNFNDYFIFAIDPDAAEQPITVAATISHGMYAVGQTADEGRDYWGYYYYASIDRAVTVGDYLFAVSNLGVSSHDINDGYKQVTFVDLMYEQEPVYIL